MKSGYKIEWTNHTLSELKTTYDYLEQNWSEKELSKLSNEIERTLSLISQNPQIFSQTKGKSIRRVVILKYNTLYYRVKEGDRVEILSFFSNRQHPDKRKT